MDRFGLEAWRLRWSVVLFMVLLGSLGFGIVDYVAGHEATAVFGDAIKGKVVVIDPGHGGPDPGAIGKNKAVEKEINLAVSKKLAALFKENGAQAYLTREEDVNLLGEGPKGQGGKLRTELGRRVQVAKDNDAQVFLSIHVNSFPSARWSGAQTFYQRGSAEGKSLATLIQAELVKEIGNKDGRQAKAEDFYVLRTAPGAAVMVEIGFISNPEESARLQQEEHQQKIAQAIYRGVGRYLKGELPPEQGKGKNVQ